MKTINNYGEAARLRGIQDAESILKVHGIKTIKQIAAYSLKGKDDYCKSKILRSKELCKQ